ncbi:hypothetical protein D3C76_953920 [compost metagenome]
MTSQQIKQHLVDVVRVKLQMTDDFVSEFLGTNLAFCCKIDNGLCKWIVHDCVKLIPLQPRHRIVPHFSYNVQVILDGSYCISKLTPELVINLVRYVKPPAIDVTFLNPILRHFQEILFNFRISRIQLRHLRDKSKCLIRRVLLFSIAKACNMEPISITRFCSMLQHILERCKSIT